MTKFDGSKTTEQWLRVLEEELPEHFTLSTWLKRANSRLDRRTAAWTDRNSEINQILRLISAVTNDKDVFIRLSCQKFAANQNNIIIEEYAGTELTTLSQKEDEDLYIYYRQTKTLLIEISVRNWVTYDGENTVILNKTKQHILKDTIAKFVFELKIPELRLHMIK